MPATLETLAHDALELAPDQRVELAHRLLASVGPGAVWHEEIVARIARYDAGEAQSVPAEKVFDHATLDETAHLLSSPANAKRLSESIHALENGQGVVRDVDLGA